MDIIISGINGRIQANYYKSKNPKAPIAVVFHDLTANGGNMNEKVNYTLFYSFVQKGYSVIRFNFQTRNSKDSSNNEGESELTDASTIVDWIQEQNEEASGFWLAGVGFGAWVAMQMLMRRVEVTGYVVVSPNPKKNDFSFFNPVPCDGLLISAENDSTINEDLLKNFVSNVNKQKTAKLKSASISGANHNYEGKLKEIFDLVVSYIP